MNRIRLYLIKEVTLCFCFPFAQRLQDPHRKVIRKFEEKKKKEKRKRERKERKRENYRKGGVRISC